MKSIPQPARLAYAAAFAAVALLSACGGGGSSTDDAQASGVVPAASPVVSTAPTVSALPQLAPAMASAMIGSCSSLAAFAFDKTTVTAAVPAAAGALRVAGRNIDAHCVVTGKMNERVSPVDAQTYAIGFEMRLPLNWNGRFLYQGNGGTDGSVATASGSVGSGGPLTNALDRGFAVISSDAGHTSAQNSLFGVDPQARIDYGYGAVKSLTPMAKALIRAAYGRAPDRSYIGGTSNGGRHAMVASSRFANDYDGVLANSPGFNLPIAAAAQLYSAQQFRKVATNPADLETAFTLPERKLVAQKILDRCDALDGAVDGLVQDIEACRTAFSIFDHVPTCTGARDGTCLSNSQKSAISAMYYGPVNSRGEHLYATQPYDPGLATTGWAGWKFTNSVGATRDPVAVGVIFQVPPDPSILQDTRSFAFNYNFDVDFPRLFATNATYTESSLAFMTPPNLTKLTTLRDRGAKMIVVAGASDGVFSIDDTKRWYDELNVENSGKAADFVRFFRVPGMNHSSGGISTDQYDALQSLINWVENGVAPDRIVATARGVGNAGGVNSDVPSSWAPNRTRPLCPYPLTARYAGAGDVERAESFICK